MGATAPPPSRLDQAADAVEASLPGGVLDFADQSRGNPTRARRGTPAVSRADGQHPPWAQR